MTSKRQFQSCEYMDCINWNIDVQNPTPQHHNQAEPFPGNVSESEHKRTSFKNKYVNKIKNKYGDVTTHSQVKLPVDSQNNRVVPVKQIETDKRQKNRQAAKESRDRKKVYIEIIEKQTRELEEELERTNKDIELVKIDIQKSTFNNNQYIGVLTSKLSHVHKKLEKLIEEERDSDDRDNELNLAIDSISYRFGATGKERKFNINQSYKQIFNFSVPTLHRYMLWSAQEGTHLFSNSEGFCKEENQKWFDEMRLLLGDLRGYDNQLQGHRKQLMEGRQNLLENIAKLCKTKDRMEQQSYDLDNLFLDIREILTPVQSAKFILFIEKYTYRDQLRYHERIGMVDEEEYLDRVLSQPRKKSKLDEP